MRVKSAPKGGEPARIVVKSAHLRKESAQLGVRSAPKGGEPARIDGQSAHPRKKPAPIGIKSAPQGRLPPLLMTNPLQKCNHHTKKSSPQKFLHLTL